MNIQNSLKSYREKYSPTLVEETGLLAIAAIIESNTGLGGISVTRQWSPVFRYIKNRNSDREILFQVAARFTQELGWPEWMVNIFRTGKKPELNLKSLTHNDLNNPTPEIQAALDVGEWQKIDVVEFSGKLMAVISPNVVHPGLNEMSVIDLGYNSSDDLRIAVFKTNHGGKKRTVGHAYIYHFDEGGSWMIAEWTGKTEWAGQLTDKRVYDATLAYRVVPATAEDYQKIAAEYEERIESAAMIEQIELALTLDAQIERQLPTYIRQLRQKRGWSQTELGKRLGISQQYVGFMERGERPVTPEIRQKLSEIAQRSPVADKLEDLVTGGYSPQEIQRQLAAMTREATGEIPRGQLWQPCAEPGCESQPICLNCLLCEEHCQCLNNNRLAVATTA